MSDNPTLLCLGLGYSAEACAHERAAKGWNIVGTSRGTPGAAAIRARGYRGIVFDGTGPSPELAAVLQSATHLLVSAAPEAAGDPLLAHHTADVMAAPRLTTIAYLSTVGVYGDTAGAWVDEESPVKPGSERSLRRVAAEAAWLALGQNAGKRVAVLRLSGIYGPGRSAIDQLRAGTARRIVKPGQVFNRIHVRDIVGAVAAVLDGRGRHTVYNVTDDEPAPPQDVVAWAADLLGMPPPPETPFAAAQLSPMAVSFYAELKRVSNARMKGDLGVRLACPTYREGLAEILAVERAA